jgi:uncharacterized membrane protein HdeD (DUF308 family)
MAAISLDAAAAAMRDTMRDTVRRNSLLYLLQGILMVITGVLALIYPSLASVAIVRLLGWFLIASGVFQGFGLIARGSIFLDGVQIGAGFSPAAFSGSCLRFISGPIFRRFPIGC